MILKWGSKKLTFVIIPDPDRAVVRFRITTRMLYLAAASVLAVLGTAVLLYFMHFKALIVTEQLKHRLDSETSELKTQLASETAEHGKMVAAKNERIEQLQQEVISLSEQAQQVKLKVEEMKKLENDLKAISQINTSKSVALAEADGNRSAMGGTELPLTEDQLMKLPETIKSAFQSLDEEMSVLEESMTDTKKQVIAKQHQLAITPTIYPTRSRTVTSSFGLRKDPFTFRLSQHNGIDFSARTGDPVFAAADGVVVSASYDDAHGNNIVIEHSKGIRTWYMHMSSLIAKRGEQVVKGQRIGLVGTTGRSTGPHLHYEVHKNGVPIDPTPYLQSSKEVEP